MREDVIGEPDTVAYDMSYISGDIGLDFVQKKGGRWNL
jgi:hypothetical protein